MSGSEANTSPEAEGGERPPVPDPEARSLEVLEWPRMRAVLRERCSSPPAARLAAALVPLREPAESRRLLEEAGEVQRLLGKGMDTSPAGGLPDLEGVFEALDARALLETTELLDVAALLEAAASTRSALGEHEGEAPRLARLARGLDDLPRLREEIRRSIDPSGEVLDAASSTLARARRRVEETARQVRSRIQAVVADPDLEAALQDRYFTLREGRYVVPVRRESRSAVPGIVHGRSSSGASFFVEPEIVVEANNEHRIAQEEVAEEIARILGQLTKAVRDDRELLEGLAEALAWIDFAWARGRLAADMEASVPELVEEPVVELEEARHPLLALHEPETVVANDLQVGGGESTFLVVTGPNTGGKTVAMKTAGLAVLMARAGLPVPAAPGGRLHPFPRVLADLGDEQSLERHLSSFSGHLRRIQEIRSHAGPEALVLLDEVVSGTDPKEGAALARALLEDLARRGSRGIVTTHYQELKGLAAEDGRFRNAGMEFDLDEMRPTFRMAYDLPGRSSALAVARRLGLDEEVVARAEELHGEAGVRLDALLEEVETLRRRIDEEKEKTAEARREAEKLAAQRRKEVERLRERDRRTLGEEEARLASVLKEAREEASRAARRLQEESDQARVEEERRRLKEIEEESKRRLRESRGEPSRPVPDAVEDLREGDTVRLRRFDKEAEVLEEPRDGHVQVSVGAVRMKVALEDLEPVEAKGSSHAPRGGESSSGSRDRGSGAATSTPEDEEIPLTPQVESNTLDLRGQTVDEALTSVDAFLDKSLRKRISPVIIIHGHGTGALRRAVREHLGGSRYVSSFRPGRRGEGEDGVTVAVL